MDFVRVDADVAAGWAIGVLMGWLWAGKVDPRFTPAKLWLQFLAPTLVTLAVILLCSSLSQVTCAWQR